MALSEISMSNPMNLQKPGSDATWRRKQVRILPIVLSTLILGLSLNASALDLLDVYQETMASDPRLIKSESEAAVYQAKEDYAFGGLLPQAQIGAQGNRTNRESIDGATGAPIDSTYDGDKYYFDVQQPLFNKPAWEAYRSSASEAEVYEVQYQDVRDLVAIDVVERFTTVLAAEDNYEFVVAEREAAEQQHREIKAKYDRQLAKVTDLLAVEARVNVLRSRELDARNEVLLARQLVSELLGREMEEPFAKLDENVAAVVDLGAAAPWIQQGVTHNPALEASRLAIEAAQSRVKEAAGRHYPTLSARLTAQKSDIGYEGAQTPKTETYVASLEFSMPLYSGGQVSAQVDEARARLRIAETEYQQKRRELHKEIQQAYLKATGAVERVAATRKALQSSQKSYEAQKASQRYGAVTIVDVLDALETLYEARRDHRQAYYDLILQTSTLYQVAGQLTPATIEKFNTWLIPGPQNHQNR